MKRMLFLTCTIALTLAHSTLQAQTAENDPSIKLQWIDPRVKLHYSEDQIKEMQQSQPGKIRELNFYFTSSYIVHNGPFAPLTAEELAKIDVKSFEHLRKKDQRAWVGYNRQGAKLELLSQNELEAKYKELQEQK